MEISHPGLRRRAALSLLALGAALAFGCVTDERLADDWMADTAASRASAPLGGEALVQRKLDLGRSYRDLVHFDATLASLQRRGDRSGVVMFSEFLDFYVAKHVLPMLEGEWQSRHPEVAVMDANVRFAVATVWVEMGSRYSASSMLDEIERRYKGRGEMLIGYPLGSQGTLAEGIASLRQQS